jgi:hypothetical protein
MQCKTFREDALLKAINANRAILGGEPVSRIISSELKAGLSLSTVISEGFVNIKIIEDNIETIRRMQKDDSRSIGCSDQQLRLLISQIQSNPKLSCSLSNLELIELGIRLIDEKGNCPLCEMEWEQGKLIEYLNKRLSDAKDAKGIQIEIVNYSDSISKPINILLSNIESIKKIAECNGDLRDELKILDSWLSELRLYLEELIVHWKSILMIVLFRPE